MSCTGGHAGNREEVLAGQVRGRLNLKDTVTVLAVKTKNGGTSSAFLTSR